MDPTAFGIVKGEVQRLPFKDDKVKAIAYAQGCFYAEQVGELMREFNFDDDRLRGLQACVGKMLPATCVGVLPILKAFSFGKNKLQALELVAVQVIDPLNYVVFNDVFSFSKERNRACEIMQRRANMGLPQAHPQTYVGGNPYPYGRPNPSVDPNDPLYRAVDKAVDGVCSALFGRPQPGLVVQRPVAYQTTTTYVTPPSGVQGLQVPPGATVTTMAPPGTYLPYAYQGVPPGSYPVGGAPPPGYPYGQAPPPYQPAAGYPTQPQWKK